MAIYSPCTFYVLHTTINSFLCHSVATVGYIMAVYTLLTKDAKKHKARTKNNIYHVNIFQITMKCMLACIPSNML